MRKVLLISIFFCFLLFMDPANAQEKIILQTDFSSGGIDPLQYAGSGSYSIFDQASDPLGTNSWGVKMEFSYSRLKRGFEILDFLGK